MTDSSPVRIVTVSTQIEAEMIREQLAQYDIPCMVRAGGPGVGAWASSATFEHDIFVPAPLASRARSLMGEFTGAASRMRKAGLVVHPRRGTERRPLCGVLFAGGEDREYREHSGGINL